MGRVIFQDQGDQCQEILPRGLNQNNSTLDLHNIKKNNFYFIIITFGDFCIIFRALLIFSTYGFIEKYLLFLI